LAFVNEELNRPIGFSSEQLEELWLRFVLGATCPEERNIFFLFLSLAKQDSRGYCRFFLNG
jgi:hypothetical protein